MGHDRRERRAAETGAGRRQKNPQGTGPKLRDELIEAAGRLLAGGTDPESLSLRAVAREAGVAAPSVYLQFASKQALVRTVVETHFRLFENAIEASVAGARDPASALLAGCLAYTHFAAERPGSYRVIFETPFHAAATADGERFLGAEAFDILVNGVAGCMRAGSARPGDPARVATDIWTSLHGMVTLRRQTSNFPWPGVEDQVRGVIEAFAGVCFSEAAVEEETNHERVE